MGYAGVGVTTAAVARVSPPASWAAGWVTLGRSRHTQRVVAAVCGQNRMAGPDPRRGEERSNFTKEWERPGRPLATPTTQSLVSHNSAPQPSGRVSLLHLLLHRCLRGCKARDGHAIGRAAHVVQPSLRTELDGSRIAAVFAANPDLQLLASSAAFPWWRFAASVPRASDRAPQTDRPARSSASRRS